MINPRLLIIVAAFVLATGLSCNRQPSDSAATLPELGTSTRPAKPDAHELRQERHQLDERVWVEEVAAQQYEQYFVRLWDRLRGSQHPLSELAGIDVPTMTIGHAQPPKVLDHRIQFVEFSQPGQSLDTTAWRTLAQQFAARGFQLVASEWHHSGFRRREGSAISEVSFVLHLARTLPSPERNRQPEQRVAARGKLEVTWSKDAAPSSATPTSVRVSELSALIRTGEPTFRRVLTYDRAANDFASAHPLIVYDLDQNGFPEIIISRWNRVYWNEGQGRFRQARFLDQAVPLTESGILADLNEDGVVDFAAVDKRGKPVMFAGASGGQFPGQPKVIAEIETPNTLAITAGDADGDGDLDLWVTQYKPSYLGGQMPTPYFDANDGDPSYFLQNDGQGNFTDRTEQVGLAKKRYRRTYSASFVDIDDDQDQDLVVVSDYAGIDLYENHQGRFIDVTDEQIPMRHLFGMAHTVADFNRDGLDDLYVIGMSSTTARRLDQLGLGRQDRPEIHEMRSDMGFGNRMLLRRGQTFTEVSNIESLARTGWSWGTSAFDFDLDGDRDLYVANGFRSGESCQDYCTTFWRHDIYTGNSTQDPTVAHLFADVMTDLNRGSISWNGYEHNALLMNIEDGSQFVDIGFLMGVGFEYDARAVVAADLDLDGRSDLLVGQYEFTGNGFVSRFHAYRNQLETNHHWIGVQLQGDADGFHPIGAKVTCRLPDTNLVARVVTGDSFLSQHPNTVQFGLGDSTQVDAIEVRWPNGQTTLLKDPASDNYHVIRPDR